MDTQIVESDDGGKGAHEQPAEGLGRKRIETLSPTARRSTTFTNTHDRPDDRAEHKPDEGTGEHTEPASGISLDHRTILQVR